MKKPNSQATLKAEANLVSIPVFASNDPVSRVMAMAVASQRDLKVSVRGERLIDREVEVVRMASHEEISHNLTLEELVAILKVKMYNENIADQTVYDLLFEARLEREWARAYRLSQSEDTGSRPHWFWKRPK